MSQHQQLKTRWSGRM